MLRCVSLHRLQHRTNTPPCLLGIALGTTAGWWLCTYRAPAHPRTTVVVSTVVAHLLWLPQAQKRRGECNHQSSVLRQRAIVSFAVDLLLARTLLVISSPSSRAPQLPSSALFSGEAGDSHRHNMQQASVTRPKSSSHGALNQWTVTVACAGHSCESSKKAISRSLIRHN